MTSNTTVAIITKALSKQNEYTAKIIATAIEEAMSDITVSAASTLILPTSDTGVIHSLWLDDSE